MTTKTRDLDELKSVEEKINGLRDQRKEAIRERDALIAQTAKGTASPGSPQFAEAQRAVAHVKSIESDLERATTEQVDMLKRLSSHSKGAAVMGNGAPPIPESGAWNSRSLLANDDVRDRLAQMSGTTMPVGRMHLGRLSDRDTLAADIAPTANMRRGEFHGVVPQLRRQLRILDLIPTGTMDGNAVPYSQESGSFSTAVETAEGALKPEGAVIYTDQTATAVTIAHWTKVRKQALADVPAVQTLIDGRLRYGVERRLQDEILSGDGVGENMRGVLNTTGIGTVAYSAAELITDQILEGITSVFLADAEANAIVMHPTNWKAALKAKAAGDGHYYSAGPFSVTPAVMWGVPLIPSAAIPVGTALVGDFTVGASLFIREGVNLLISDSDQDDFVKNKVTLLAEMRAALAVWNPSVFTVVNLAP